jgi:hypothetical protein
MPKVVRGDVVIGFSLQVQRKNGHTNASSGAECNVEVTFAVLLLRNLGHRSGHEQALPTYLLRYEFTDSPHRLN